LTAEIEIPVLEGEVPRFGVETARSCGVVAGAPR
jgi:hypothetical protein